MKTQLLFKNIFTKALKDWPEEINFKNLVQYDSGNFIVEGLYELAEKIEQSYINQDNEIIMRNFHCCLYTVLLDLAKYSLKIKLEDLRPEIVQEQFEKSIKEGLEDGLNWSEKSINLIQNYFKVNYPEK